MLGKLKDLFTSKPSDATDKEVPAQPIVMGLSVKGSFSIDPLMLRLSDTHFVTEGIAPSQIVKYVGEVDLDDVKIYRFYTDDSAFLQVVTNGGSEDQDIVDVKLFHYYKTVTPTQKGWDDLITKTIGDKSFTIEEEGATYERVWESTGDFHPPVAMREKTIDQYGDASYTDQFIMLYERPVGDTGETESLLLSAEESDDGMGSLERVFVISTGMTLTPASITTYG